MPHECFADEIAIDFPSVGRVVERMRDRFLGVADDVLRTEVSVTPSEAWHGLVVPVDVPVRSACPACGGRGGTWTDSCLRCRGTGESLTYHAVRVNVPRRIADGARIRFRLRVPDLEAVRVELRVAIRPAAL
jgi:hypothetical protein